MLNFRLSPTRRVYLSNRDRLGVVFGMVVAGLAVAVLVKVTGIAFSPSDVDRSAGQSERERIDTRLGRPSTDQPPGVVIATDEGKPPQGPLFAGVDPAGLQRLRDDAPFRQEETPVWFQLLAVLEGNQQATLDKASVGQVTFAQLLKQSATYRGKLVSVNGMICRANWTPVTQKDRGIQGYYELWVRPDDNPAWPIVVHCLHLPEAFPTGMDVREQAAISGLFYKRWAYQAQDGLRTAPCLLARTFRWEKPVQIPPRGATVSLRSVLIVLAGGAVIGVWVVVRLLSGSRPRRPLRPEPPPSFEALKQRESTAGSADAASGLPPGPTSSDQETRP